MAKSLLAVFILALIDLLLKSWFFKYFNSGHSGIIAIHQNSGIFLGFLQETNTVIRTVTLSSFLGFIFTFIYFFQYLIVEKIPLLRAGFTLFLAGISGNVADRAYYGYVRDYLNFFDETSFNLADIYLLLGFIFIIIAIFKYGEILWYPNTGRKFNINFSKEQLVFSSKILLTLGFYFLIVVFFCLSFFTVNELPRSLYIAFVFGLLSLSLIFGLIIFFFSCILFDRMTGPLVALENFIDDLEKGNERDLFLRKDDYFKRLENVSLKIKRLNNKKGSL